MHKENRTVKMYKENQTVKWYIGNNYGTFHNQTVTDITVDDNGYAYGLWRSISVGSFHIDNETWHVI